MTLLEEEARSHRTQIGAGAGGDLESWTRVTKPGSTGGGGRGRKRAEMVVAEMRIEKRR